MVRPSVAGLATLLLFLVVGACSGGGDASSSGRPAGVAATLELEASYPEAFSYLSGVRELSDGTLLAADPLSQVLLRVDLQAGTADTLGRVGEGPQEYKQPDQVFPLPGDSTLLVDIGKMVLTVVGPDGAFRDAIRMAEPREDGAMEVLLPRTLDRQGRIYFTGSRGLSTDGPQDSTLVLRHDPGSRVTDTVGWVWRPEPIVSRSGDNVRMMSRQMEGRDDWAVGPDGAFAIVRAADYSVEWRHPDGRETKGPPNPVQQRSITEEDKLAFLENRSSAGLMMMVSSSSSGGVQMSMSRGGGGRVMGEPNTLDFQWAETFPAFRPDRSMVSPGGELWVERWLPSDMAPEMDLFNGEGEKLGSVALPQGRQLVGFGTTEEGEPAVYLVRTDEFDLKWLERYRIVR